MIWEQFSTSIELVFKPGFLHLHSFSGLDNCKPFTQTQIIYTCKAYYFCLKYYNRHSKALQLFNKYLLLCNGTQLIYFWNIYNKLLIINAIFVWQRINQSDFARSLHFLWLAYCLYTRHDVMALWFKNDPSSMGCIINYAIVQNWGRLWL